MERALAIIATLAAGALVAFQPPANAQMAKFVGNLGATFVSLLISLAIIAVLLVVFGSPSDLGNIGQLKPEHLLGGIAGAAIVGVSLVTVGPLGAGGVVAVTVCTQLIVSAYLDRAGVLGLAGEAITLTQLTGFVLLIAGTLLVTLK
jgi:transporter family-2 protein